MWKMSPCGTQSFGPSIKKNTSVSSLKSVDQARSFYRRQILAVGEPTGAFDLLADTPIKMTADHYGHLEPMGGGSADSRL